MTFCHIKQTMLALLLIHLLVTTQPACAAKPAISYQPASSQISITASETPLHELMAQIASQTGVKISVAPTADQTVTIHLAEKPLDEALKHIARSYHLNHLFVHATRNGKSQLREMKILPKISTTAQNRLPTQTPVAMTTEQRRQLIDQYKADKARARHQQHSLPTTQPKPHHLKMPSDDTERHHQELHPLPDKHPQPHFSGLNTRNEKED